MWFLLGIWGSLKLIEISPVKGEEFEKIAKKIDIVKVEKNKIVGIIEEEEIEEITKEGYEVKILIEDYEEYIKNKLTLPEYHSYDELMKKIEELVSNYQEITKLDTLGYSVEGRPIVGVKISENPEIKELEPCIRFTGAHHGDEHITKEVMFFLIKYLVENYSTSSLVKNLLGSREIWVVPMVNPDGVYYSRRRNANGVDLNRDYGYMWGGWGGSPFPYSQPETKAMWKQVEEEGVVLNFDYHSPVAIVNTIWDHTGRYALDDKIIMEIGREYGKLSSYPVIRGYYWYQVKGSSQDGIYGTDGCLGYTIEIPEVEKIEEVFEKNLGSMLKMIERTGKSGVCGVVLGGSNFPIKARIWVEGVGQVVYSHSETGYYCKLLPPGIYTLKFEANRYKEKIVNSIVVTDSKLTRVDVVLSPGGSIYGHKIVSITMPMNVNSNNGCKIIGKPDGNFCSLGTGGCVVVDIGEEVECEEIIIKEGKDGKEGEEYEVLVSHREWGNFMSVGRGEGGEAFKLREKIRYIKIVDKTEERDTTLYAGFDLDGIEVIPLVHVVNKVITNPFRKFTIILPTKSFFPFSVKIYNSMGRLIEEQHSSHHGVLKWEPPSLASGVYFYRIKLKPNKIIQGKMVLIK